MPKRKKSRRAAIVASAEFAGRTLGRVAGTLASLKARLPVDEAGAALDSGRRTLTSLAAEAGARSAAVLKKTQATTRKTRKAATRARRRGAKLVASARRTTRAAVTRAKKAVTKARKTVSRRAARLKR